jgi:cytochrome c-type biogenesis protein
MDLNGIGPGMALLAGVLAFFSPCVVSLLPVYFSVLAGSAQQQAGKGTFLLNTFFFITGFSAVFILLGLSATAAGRYLLVNRLFMLKVAGAFVIFFGLFLAGALKLPFLLKERRKELRFSNITPPAAFLLGGAFSLGWTPCIGPVLSSVLIMAGSARSFRAGLWLLTAFSLGFALPFMALAAVAERTSGLLKAVKGYLPLMQRAAGMLLILMGVLLFFDRL